MNFPWFYVKPPWSEISYDICFSDYRNHFLQFFFCLEPFLEINLLRAVVLRCILLTYLLKLLLSFHHDKHLKLNLKGLMNVISNCILHYFFNLKYPYWKICFSKYVHLDLPQIIKWFLINPWIVLIIIYLGRKHLSHEF